MPIVELHNIRKVYDTKVAVDGLSLNIEPGTMFGLLGPNGSGKTSSIRMMIGMTVPDSGTVRLFGQPFSRTLLNRVGYLPEERGLYKKMKVLDQLTFLGQLHGLVETDSRKRSRDWCSPRACSRRFSSSLRCCMSPSSSSWTSPSAASIPSMLSSS
jgi:ABC-2 type transport system ATP-binding protein